MAITTQPIVISAGTSLSAPLSIGMRKAVRVGMPSDWTPAALTFLLALDDAGTTWLDLYRAAEGTSGLWAPYETGVQSVIPNSILLLPSDAGLNVPWLKLRSGTRSQPINQSADRTFAIMFGD